MQQQLEKRSTAAAKREAESRRHLQRLAEAATRRERDNALLRVQDDGIRLGSLSVMRAGPIGKCNLSVCCLSNPSLGTLPLGAGCSLR